MIYGSVLKQSEKDFEIILVNDGSTDNSGEICDEYAAKNQDIVRVIHKENEGLLTARLEAISAAKGEYLMFLDSDDIYYPGLLKYVKETIYDTNADMLIWDLEKIME